MPYAPPNKGRRYPAETLTRSEVGRLLEQVGGRSSTALRNRAMIATMYRGALRVAECLALRPSDVDPVTGELHVRRGKGGKDRRIKLDAGSLAMVNEWRERRATLGFTGHQPLFCSIKSQGPGKPAGSELATPYLRRLLPTLAKRAKIDKRVHPHGLRHSRAAELAAEGTPPNVIQRVLGHSSLATTSTYLDHVHPAQVYDAMESDWKPPKVGAADRRGRGS